MYADFPPIIQAEIQYCLEQGNLKAAKIIYNEAVIQRVANQKYYASNNNIYPHQKEYTDCLLSISV